MRTNTTIIILVVLITLLAAGRLGLYWRQQQQPEREAYISWWQGATPDSVTKLTIQAEDKTLEINRGGSGWQTGEFPVNGVTLQNLLQALLIPESVEVIAESPNSHENLGIASTSATLTLTANNGDKRIVLGDVNGLGRYVKLEGENRVYRIPSLPPTVGSTQARDWTDTTISRIDAQAITSLEWQQKDGFKIVRQDGNWINEAGKVLDTTKISPVLMLLESLATEGLLTDEEQESLTDTPAFVLAVLQDGTENITLNVYEASDFKAIASSQQPGVYKISEEIFRDLSLTRAGLLEKTPNE